MIPLFKRITRRRFLEISALTAAAGLYSCNSSLDKSDSIKDLKKYPVTIIGSGLGGLSCGAYLAKAGFPVTVIEQNYMAGGYAGSFTRGKYRFDISLHAVSVNDNATSLIFNELGLDKRLEIVPLKNSHRIISDKRDIIIPDSNPDEYISMLSKMFPEEKKGIKKIINTFISVEREVFKFSQKKDFIKILFPFQFPEMWAIRNKTLSQLIDEHIKSKELKNIISYLWGYYGLPPKKLSAFYYAVATGGYLRNGSHYIKGQSQKLTDSLVEIIKENDGKIIYNTEVKEITVKNKVVTGVKTSSGKIFNSQIVVSNTNIPDTFEKMISEKNEYTSYYKKDTYRPSISTFIIWLGLKGKPYKDIKGCSLGIDDNIDSWTDYSNAIKGNFNRINFGITLYDNYHKGYSKAGTSTLVLVCNSGFEFWRKFESDYISGNKNKYNKEKKRIADLLIKRAEKILPGLSHHIDTMVTATPLTNMTFTKNREGAIYGFEQSLDNAYMKRIDNRTPVQGLYVSSAWGNPGGGYTGVLRAGRDASRMIISDISGT
jgi:all-trans-retinol 13,14-reductase